MAHKSKRNMFFCPKCGPFIQVMKEIWTKESDGPYKLEFIQHIDGKAKIIDKVKIKSKPDGEHLEYSFCGKCWMLISNEQDINWTSQSLPF